MKHIAQNKFINALLTLLVLFRIIKSADEYTTESMEYKSVSGIGVGTFVLIGFIIIGILICIIGLGTPMPVIFVLIGTILPLLVFVILAFAPKKIDENKQNQPNQKKDTFMVARWFYFCIMLCLFIAMLFVYCQIWSITIIPPKVDSRSKESNDAKKSDKKKKVKQVFINNEDNILSMNTDKKKGGFNVFGSPSHNNNESLISQNRPSMKSGGDILP